MENKDINMALLKDLMTTPPMTAEQHAAIVRKRIEHRRMIEDARNIEKFRREQQEMR